MPDIVVLTDDRIRDIFELKFVPHDLVVFENDLSKLFRYWKNDTCEYHRQLDPETGKWNQPKMLHDVDQRGDGCLACWAPYAAKAMVSIAVRSFSPFG